MYSLSMDGKINPMDQKINPIKRVHHGYISWHLNENDMKKVENRYALKKDYDYPLCEDEINKNDKDECVKNYETNEDLHFIFYWVKDYETDEGTLNIDVRFK